VPTELQDGDILLVCIDPQDMETVDYLIRLGEQAQEVVSGNSPGALESHVMLYTDLRTPDEMAETKELKLLRPGMKLAHLIHMEPAGLVGCPLYASKLNDQGEPHTETLRILRCKDKKLAECAAQVAADMFMNIQNKKYNWFQYGQIGANVINSGLSNVMSYEAAKAVSIGWTAWSMYAAIQTGGLSLLAWEGVKTLSWYGGSWLLSKAGQGAEYESQKTGALKPGKLWGKTDEFELFSQFHKFYDRGGQLHGGLSLGEVCSSFAILCYQLAYIKLVRYYGHKGYSDLGPKHLQSPMGLRDLFVKSGLFEDKGTFEGAYDPENPNALADIDQYRKDYGPRLLAKSQRFNYAKQGKRAAEAPF